MASKSDRVIEAAKAATPPWDCELNPIGTGESLDLTRGDEHLSFYWDAGSLIHPLTYVLTGVREVKLRNVSQAMSIIKGTPTYATRKNGPVRQRGKAESGVSLSEPKTVPTSVGLPFDPVEATDAEIIRALRGKTLTWLNDMMGDYETATIPDKKLVEIKDPENPGQMKKVWRTNRNISMSTSAAGRRIITFPAVNEQFRSVGLDRLVQVK